MKGIIFDIKPFAIHDGPGIRQTVFMKGCPLRCKWCHNPEGLHSVPQLMVSRNGCTQCGLCKQVCLTPDACTACGTCIQACPLRLRKIAGEKLSPQQLVNRLLPNAEYYAKSGGGVTFSGGEPLMQPDFVLETVALLGSSFHTALETSGYGNPEIFGAFQKAFSLVMMDIKTMDDTVHKEYTGVSNQVILQNAGQLIEGTTPFIIRIPLIPGVNDTSENIRAVGEFLKGAKALERVELLPYHQTAGAKYTMLGMDYQPGFDEGKATRQNGQILESYGIRSRIL